MWNTHRFHGMGVTDKKLRVVAQVIDDRSIVQFRERFL
ncbi:hypothetical protein LTSEALA_5549 [Salmonella enterica subsp. enterica serovar Alachua str. R6-377]|uniref:Uncharacterized protein n=1 Tax=Salmonella enterica subsp. enterica serovar Alachua str. R6-377 TaxID=913241 RepID=G5LW31_SALET|nr:hypothetical protein LTSEALA_5549 [Salmonella enterica subsp. enterica serovar Alachua str. R6-377]